MADQVEGASKTYGAAMGATFKAMQDYNSKLVQVFQTNAEANLQLGQMLMQIRSPADFIETMSKSVRERTELIAGQTKELAALGQETARCAIEDCMSLHRGGGSPSMRIARVARTGRAEPHARRTSHGAV